MKGVAAVRDVHRAVDGVQADRAACDDLWSRCCWLRRSAGFGRPLALGQDEAHYLDREADEARDVDREQHELESEREGQHDQRRPDAQLVAVRLRRVAAVACRVCQCDAYEEERHRAEYE